MRRRLVLSTILVVTIVLVMISVPVVFILREAATNELRARTGQEASAVVAALATPLSAGDVPDLALTDGMVAPGDGVRILDADGVVIAERNVDGIDAPFRSTAEGPSGTSVQVIASSSDVDRRFRDQLVRLAFLALVAVALAAMLAFAQARQLATPLERLARAAERLGDGDFTVSGPTSTGIAEIDAISRAIRLSANRVERMLDSERGFTADATHQLRTGLTGLAMRLEILERHPDAAVATEAAATLGQIHDLNTTLDELLRVARRGSTGERTDLDVVTLVEDHVSDWRAQFSKKRRQIVVTIGNVQPVIGTPGLVGQILDVLLENALRHGRGTVAILVHDTSVLVEDEGAGIDEADVAAIFDRPEDHHAAHGRGLALARRLAQADGGQLELVAPRPAQFRLSLLPAHV
ncbi:MAG: HAMP domain-containing histidine kinase [Ilumatobacter sp.]|nr:HAMP domain-containing histidine kinase [Ilumatobacter sp.]